MKHPQFNFRQPAVDRFIEVMTTAHILLDSDIRGEILQNIEEYYYFLAKLQNRVYEMIEGTKTHSSYTFLSNPAPVETNFSITFDKTYFKENMFNEKQPEQINRIAERIVNAGRKRYAGKKEKETLPLSDPAKKIIQKATEEDFETVKDVTDCLILGSAIALLDGSVIIHPKHITEAIQYKNCKIYKGELVKRAR